MSDMVVDSVTMPESEPMDNYIITLTDRHFMGGDKGESTSTMYGSLELLDDGYVISYTEHAGEFAGCVTCVKVSTNPESVYLSRTGSYAADMLIEPGRRNSCQYDTPFGGVVLGIYGYKLDTEMRESGGELMFAYSLDIGGGMVSENELKYSLRKINRE